MSAWIKVIRTLTNRAIPPGQQHLVTCHYAGDLTALLHSTSKGFSISTFYYHFPSPTPSCACILTCVHVCICACTHLSPPLHSCLCHHPYTPRTSHEKRLPSSTELGRGRKGSLTTTTLSISTAETKVQSSQNVQKFKNCVSLAFLPFHFYTEWHGKCISLLTPATWEWCSESKRNTPQQITYFICLVTSDEGIKTTNVRTQFPKKNPSFFCYQWTQDPGALSCMHNVNDRTVLHMFYFHVYLIGKQVLMAC